MIYRVGLVQPGLDQFGFEVIVEADIIVNASIIALREYPNHIVKHITEDPAYAIIK